MHVYIGAPLYSIRVWPYMKFVKISSIISVNEEFARWLAVMAPFHRFNFSPFDKLYITNSFIEFMSNGNNISRTLFNSTDKI